MKLIECLVLIISISLFGLISTTMIVPVIKNTSQIKVIESKLERDKFIVNAVCEVFDNSSNSEILMNESLLISRCSKVWNLDSFLITEMNGYYKAEWSFENEKTTYLVKKRK